MAPMAVSPISPPSPTLDSTSKLTKAGTRNTLAKTISNPSPAIADLDASKLTITHNLNPKPVPAPNSPEVWSQTCTSDHMVMARWTQQSGWDAPEIRPFGPLSISPIASVLHYATECFEGMKAYRGDDGRVRLFRPDRNARRFLQSAARIALPGFPPEEFLKLLERFVALEAPRWLPENGSFLYLRPTMIATAAALGVQKPKEALLYIVAVCFPPLDEASGPSSISGTLGTSNGVVPSTTDKQSTTAPAKSRGMRLLASRHDMIRAWPGGFGNAKVGANYGPSLIAQGEARARGYEQILWLFGEENYVTEAGGSNFFVLWRSKQSGKLELVTAPLGDGVILEGVTRASVLALARARLSGEMGEQVDVVERQFTMEEVVSANEEGRLLEGFGAGTAFFIAPVSEVHYRGVDVLLPLGQAAGGAKENEGKEIAMTIKSWLKDIMYGREQHEWGVVIEEDLPQLE